MSKDQVLMMIAAIVATFTSVAALMTYAGNREKIADAMVDEVLRSTEKNGSMMTPGRDALAFTVYYQCAGKPEQSMWMLAKDEAAAKKIIQKLFDCPTTRLVEDPEYWSDER